MSDIAIRCEGLSKKYQVGERERYKALRDTITNTLHTPFRVLRSALNGSRRVSTNDNTFWALKDLSFEIKRGEVVGVIGRNGAGKSTLLKILSRITSPTKGEVEIIGRVASLLEVGTGFHPELTGRENIYLNGAILGMKKTEIKKKFDEIVAFAEIERFIDTPVKRYSSGMYVRLAFAVAAHLEPEILVVDEVLAVGDAAFQQKCIGKMEGVARTEGRTVLFVSHNMMAIKQLCRTGIWLDSGQMKQIGPTNEVAQAYALSMQTSARGGHFTTRAIKGDGAVELISYLVTNAGGETNPPPGTKEDVLINVTLRAKNFIGQPACGVSIYNEFGVLLTCINTVEQGIVLPPIPTGEVRICIRLNKTTFLPGTYTASFWLMNPQGHIYVMTENSIIFEIAQVPLYGTCQIDYRWGCVYSDVRFSVEPRVKGMLAL